MVFIPKHGWIQDPFLPLEFLCEQASHRHLAAGMNEARGLLSLPCSQASQISMCDLASYATAGRLFCQESAVLWRKEPYFKRDYKPSLLLEKMGMEGGREMGLGLTPVHTEFGVPLESTCSDTSHHPFSLHHLWVLQFYFLSISHGTL